MSVSLVPDPEVVITKQVEAPPPPVEEPPVDLAELKDLALESMGFGPKKEEPKEEKPKPEKPGDKPEEKPQPKPADKPKKPKAAAPAPAPVPPTADEIASRVAERMREPAPAPSSHIHVQASPQELEDQKKREVFAVMAENSAEDRDLASKFDDFLVMEKSYRDKWQAANPGKAFDAEDEEHSEFYGEHEPQYNEDRFIRAEAKLEARQEATNILARAERKRTEEELRAKTITKLREQDKVVESTLIKAIDPKVEVGMDKLGETDPILESVLEPLLPTLKALTAENTLWNTKELNYRRDPNNPVCDTLSKAINKFEQELLQEPPEDQIMEDGRKLVHIADFNKMSDAEKAKHWSIWVDQEVAVRRLLMRDFVNYARTKLEKMRGHTGKQPQASESPRTQSPPEPVEPKSSSSINRPRFPNTVGGAENVSVPVNGEGLSINDRRMIGNSMFEN